jgi:hypothetical protein
MSDHVDAPPELMPLEPAAWCSQPSTKKKQRAFLRQITDGIERDAPHLVAYIAALRLLGTWMYNRVPAHRARVQSEPLTEDIIDLIRQWHRLDPNMPQHVIGSRVGVNQGRVNEVLRGIRL